VPCKVHLTLFIVCQPNLVCLLSVNQIMFSKSGINVAIRTDRIPVIHIVPLGLWRRSSCKYL